MVTLLIAVGLLGCAAPECAGACGDPADPAPDGEDTAAMVYSSEPPVPEWTAEDVGEQIEALVALGAPNPVDLAQIFGDLMTRGDELCPGDTSQFEQIPGCETADGYVYSGTAFLTVGEWLFIDHDRVPIIWFHGGDFEIRRPDGTRFSGGGDLDYTTEKGDALVSTFTLAGSWQDEARIDWLGQTFSGVYSAEVVRTETDHAITLSGGIGVGDLDLNFVDMAWDSSGPCAGAATGALQVRGPRGYWYGWDLGHDCDACGAVTFHQDQDLGELCLDLTEWGNALYELSRPR